jgi:hypothetical protein
MTEKAAALSSVHIGPNECTGALLARDPCWLRAEQLFRPPHRAACGGYRA